jgi:polysaccharide chain length determinant protein (PEP-CTERM system associated)
MEDTHIHALDYLSVIRRRKWWLVLPIVASVVVGLLLVRYLPKQYRSSTTLGVEAPMVSPNLVNQATTYDNQERQRALSLQMLSVPVLRRVADEERLGSGDSVIGRMRRAIDITVPEPVAATTEPRRLDTFVVSYSDSDPGRAQRVTGRLARVFVDENSKTRTEHAEDTSAFLAQQLGESQKRLTALEARLRREKESHMGQLPEQTQANLQTLSGMRQQLEANATALRGEQDRLSVIERQIESMRQGSAEALLVSRGNEGPTAETRAITIERELAAAKATYTDKHPEIQRLQEELAAARRDAAAVRQRPIADRTAQLQTDPAYRQLITDQDIARLRVRELQRATSDAQRQISVYQARVEAAPMVEQQLATLQRDYDLEKQQYADLSAKQHAATLAENIEKNRGGEQFTILYPAGFPAEPTKPIPMRVMLVSILAGIVIGGALTLGREYLDRSVHDIRELKDEFELPVLGKVARIQPV